VKKRFELIVLLLGVFAHSLNLILAIPSLPTSVSNPLNCTFEPIYQEPTETGINIRDVWCNLTDGTSPILNANISHSTYDTNDWYASGKMSEKGWYIGYNIVRNAYNLTDNNFTIYGSRRIDIGRRLMLRYGLFTYPFPHINQTLNLLVKAGSEASLLKARVCNHTAQDLVFEGTPTTSVKFSEQDYCQLADSVNATVWNVSYSNWTWVSFDLTSAYNNVTSGMSGSKYYTILIGSTDNVTIDPVGWSIESRWMPPQHNSTLEAFRLLNSSVDFSAIDSEGYPSNGVYNHTYNINMSGNVLLFHLNETTGNAIDYSGMGNNGVVTGATQNVDARFDKGYSLDGRGDYIKVSDDDSLDLTTEVTAGLWVKFSSLPGWQSLIHKGSTTANTYTLYLEQRNGRLYNYNTISTSSAVLTAGKWHFIVYTANSSVERLYVDGEVVAEESEQFDGMDNNNDVYIGRSGARATRENVDGIIDEVFIFNRSLNADEIYMLYIHGKKKLITDNRTHNVTTYRKDKNLILLSDSLGFNETVSYLEFDEDDDVAEFQNLTSFHSVGNGSFTSCFFFKRTRSNYWEKLWACDGSMEILTGDKYIRMAVQREGSTSWYIVQSDKLPVDTNWHHICGIRNTLEEKLELLLDGELVAMLDFDNSYVIKNASQCVMGRDVDSGGADDYFRGQLAQFFFHNDAHTDVDVFEGINQAWWQVALSDEEFSNVYAVGEVLNSTTVNWTDEPTHTPIAIVKIYNMNNDSAYMVWNDTGNMYRYTYYTNKPEMATSQGSAGVNFTTLFEYNSSVNDTAYWHVRGATNSSCEINSYGWVNSSKTGQYQEWYVNWSVNSTIPVSKKGLVICSPSGSCHTHISEGYITTEDSPSVIANVEYGNYSFYCYSKNDFDTETRNSSSYNLTVGCWSAYDDYNGTNQGLELKGDLYVCQGHHTMISRLGDAVIVNPRGEYKMYLFGNTIFDGGNQRGSHANESDYRTMFWGYDIYDHSMNPNGLVTIQNGDVGFFFQNNMTNTYFANYDFVNMSVSFYLKQDYAINFSILNNTFDGFGYNNQSAIYVTGTNVQIVHNNFTNPSSGHSSNVYCRGCSNVTLEQNYYWDINNLAIYSNGNNRTVNTVVGNFTCEVGETGSQYPYANYITGSGDTTYLNGADLYGEIIDYYPCTSLRAPAASSGDSSASSSEGGVAEFYIGVLDELSGGTYSGNLSYGWKMIFTYNGENHTVKIRNIYRDKSEVRFEISSNVFDVAISENERKRIDLDGDGREDIVLTLEEIFDVLKVRVKLEIIPKESFVKSNGSAKDEEVAASPPVNESILEWILGVISLTTVLVFVGLYIWKRSRKGLKWNFWFFLWKLRS